MVGKVQAFGATDVGCVRDHNEDALWVDPDADLYIVADGMGGHADGEVASAIVIETVPAALRSGQSLVDALNDAHQAVKSAVTDGRGAAGMGSTAVALRMKGVDYEIAWVGDSRAYLWDGAKLRQLSQDHSFVQELLAINAITKEQAERHPMRNIITQSLGLGGSDQVRPGTVTGRLHRGEQILLCSDGLSNEVSNEEIAAVFALDEDTGTQVRSLIDKARQGGGADNITAVLVRAPDDAPPGPSAD